MSTKGPSSEEAELAEFQRQTQAVLRRLEGYQEVVRQSVAAREAMSKALEAEIQSRPTPKVRTPSRLSDPKLDELKARNRKLEADFQKLDEKVKNLRL